MLVTGCNSHNGNRVNKAETTIYKSLHHDELTIEEAFSCIKDEFMTKETFYYTDLLAIEYGGDMTENLELEFKKNNNYYDVIYLQFTFKTGDQDYISMQKNHSYTYEAYLVKATKRDKWVINKMNEVFVN